MTVIDNDNTVSIIKTNFAHPDNRDVAEESKAAERQV